MKPIAIFRHLECEGPGYFADVLTKHELEHTLIHIDQSDTVPDSINNFSALVFMGGPMSVNDPLPWIEKELALIQQAAQAKMPVLGHCLGGQLICKALGGLVGANHEKEIGWHKVQKIENNVSNSWLSELPDNFEAFHWHGETFSVPDGATAILKSDLCTHQAFAMDNILALQCHVEMTGDMVKEWVQEYANELATPTVGIQSGDEILRNVETKSVLLNQAADSLYQRWLEPLIANKHA